MSAAEWARCKPWIEAALEYAFGYTIDDVWQAVEDGEAIFWPGRASAVITQVWIFPQAKALNYWLAGGDLDELVNEMRPLIEERAKAAGLTHIIIAGRGGWTRALRATGYAPIWTALGKEIAA